MSLPSITNLLMFSAKLKLKFSLLIVLMTLKSIWKRVLNLLLALYTLFWHLNKLLSRNSLRKISTRVSSDQPHLRMVHWSYLLRRKMVHCASVDFRSLNHISKKDCYPLPLISDLLDSPCKAWVYSKIDLHHAYHLVCIANSDEWKTAFRTRYGSFK